MSKQSYGSLDLISHGQNVSHYADDIFRCIFVNEKFCILNKISLQLAPKGLIEYSPAFGWDNDLALNRWQAITWTNADPIHWRIYVALGRDELIKPPGLCFSINIIFPGMGIPIGEK